MIDQNEMKRLLEEIPEDDLRSAGPLLVVKLGAEELVEDAALYDPDSAACEALCLSLAMGVDDEGMEDDSVEISREENGVPLAELTLSQDGVEVADSDDISLLFRNCSGKTVTVAGESIEGDGYLLLKNLSGEELDRAVQAYLKMGGGVWC